jgi:gliding-associated putative ABC transporter substrate-binding component GldG
MKKKVYITTALLVAILLVVNLLSHEFHFRFDLTDENQYTLSPATLEILRSLEEPVTVKAYFSQDLPQNIVKTRQDFQELLIEYANRSKGMVQYEFINPNEEEATQNIAVKNGIQPVLINVREKDQVKQQKAYLGATLSLGERREVIPFIQPGSAMEYTLSTAIKKIAVLNKPVAGFIVGHGEPSLRELSQLNEQLGVLYQTQEVSLGDTAQIPQSVKTLVLIRPMDTIPFTHLAKLDEFLERGGGIAIAINRVNGDLQKAQGETVNTGLENWLQQKGIEVADDFIVDSKCGSVTVQQQQGYFTIQSQVQMPFLPLITMFADHPISKGLENVLFEFASPVRYIGDTTKKFTPLAYTSAQSNQLKAPLYFDINKQWTDLDFPLRHLVVAAAIEGRLSGITKTKMVVIGDGDFVVNGLSQQPRKLQPDNVNLLSNSIDWLSDETGLIGLRTKGATSRPLDTIEDGTKTLLKYVNFGLPILLVIGYGIVRMQRNRMKRYKRMSENYEEAQ